MIGSPSLEERAFQASQSPFTLRLTRPAPRECPAHPPRVGPGKIGGGD
jgi:hypothetical protein